ncbi:MAG: Delta-aminolevulinic acid dehydratase [Chlamydiales bacterium]|nr:Delta-aminolevulinic acid dehydratase [Chlamydiales bacterium]
MPPFIRPRRNRKSQAIRSLVRETHLGVSDLIYPQFILEGEGVRSSVKSMPGIERLSLDGVLRQAERLAELGIPAIALFPMIDRELKNSIGSESLNPDGVLQRAIRALKAEFPHICVISDVALDPYTSHGHDGLVCEDGEVLNDKSVDLLVKMALVQAEAGVDVVAPSDMMDGRVRAIREGLDAAGFLNVSIHAYCAKYASAFYGPYRDAVSSHPVAGDKKSYQLNPANKREAVLEAMLDQSEGADILMVKPALAYLDVIALMKEVAHLPISAYQVSGEYAMIKAAAQNGWVDEQSVFLESVLSIKRAGADMIFTYAAPQIAQWLKNGALD